jgi:hypothetical protein
MGKKYINDEQLDPKPEIILTNITIRDNQDKN